MNPKTPTSASSAVPWLEHFAEQGRPVQKTLLTSFPFSIGRNDDTDLPINSNCVSREHAVIVRAGDSYRVRDLDSRNGTSVNGQRIEEATLSDGDILAIADVEFTFFSGVAQAPRKTVTQVIGFRHSDSSKLKSTDVIRSVRRLQETLLQGAQRVSYQPIAALATGRPVGFQAVSRLGQPGAQLSEADRLVLGAHARLATRLRESFFLMAAEGSLEHPGSKLFLPLDADMDQEFLDRLLWRLATVLPDLGCLVLELPDSAVSSAPYFLALYQQARASGVGLCYNEFAAGKTRLEEYARTAPDYLRLSRSMMRGLWQDANRRSQSQKLIETCLSMGCEVIGVDVDSAQQAELLLEIGCPFGMGKLFPDGHAPLKSSGLQPASSELLFA